MNDRGILALIEEWTDVLDTRRKGEVKDGNLHLPRPEHPGGAVLVQTLQSDRRNDRSAGFGSLGQTRVPVPPMRQSHNDANGHHPHPGLRRQRRHVRAGGSRFVVDKNSNTLIFRGSGEDWEKVVELIEQLDKPVPSVLIEVLIAEILLTDQHRSGFEFLARSMLDDYGVQGGTLNALGLQAGALSLVARKRRADPCGAQLLRRGQPRRRSAHVRTSW